MFSTNVFHISAPRTSKRRSARFFGIFAALGGLALAVSPASALATEGCPAVTEAQAFSQFGDANWYTLVSGGSFESTPTGWTLSGGAAQTSGSESYKVTGTLGKYSLALPSGATAQSPYICVDKSYRALRFFAIAAEKSASIGVSVVYKTPSGPYVISVGTVNPGSSWAASEKLPTYAGPASAESNGTAQVAVRLTEKSGSSHVDDVYIDPRMR